MNFAKEEISDNEEEDESNNTAGELDQIFDACKLEEGTKMYEVHCMQHYEGHCR